MDAALKKRLRTSYRGWRTTCAHCKWAKKQEHHAAYQEAIREAVVYGNTLQLPKAFGQLQVNEGFKSDPVGWTEGFACGVMEGDTFDGGPVSWYWRLPDGMPRDKGLRWKKTPASALIDLIEYLERTYP